MSTGTGASPDFTEDCEAVWRQVVAAVAKRGFPHQDAEVVAAEILAAMTAEPGRFTALLDGVDGHVERLDRLALAVYVGVLKAERERRQATDVI